MNVEEVVNSAVSLINRQYFNHQVELVVDIQEDIYATMGNPFRLEQVLLNILSNAKSAVEKKLEQKKDSTYKKKINLSLKKDNDTIFIKITDNGIGMPSKVMNKIFEPFYTTKDQHSGTGLGLSISYGIIKEMKGKIRVESKEYEFTKLTIELPLIDY